MDPESQKALLGRGPVVALWASPETILERAMRKPGERPLLQVENPLERIRTLLGPGPPSTARPTSTSPPTGVAWRKWWRRS